MTGVVHLGAVAALATVSTLWPCLVLALVEGDAGATARISLVLVLGSLLSLLVMQAIRGRSRRLQRMHGLLAVVVVWVIAIASGTLLSMTLLGLSWDRAVFEATSALTTTGATTLLERGALPTPFLFWRVTLEWFGGLLTLACLMQIVAPAGLGGLPQFTAQLFSRPSRGGDTDKGERPLVEETTSLRRSRLIGQRYAAATIAVWLALLPNGPPPLEAMMLAMITIGTAGFVFFDTALLDTLELHTIAVMAVGLFFGATSILWQSGANLTANRFLRRNVEMIAILVIVALIAFGIAVRIASVSGLSAVGGETIVEGLFAASSLVATSGLETRPGIIALLPDVFVLTLVFAGGSLFSSTGGVKLYRLLGLLRYAERELVSLIYPHSVSSLRIGGRPVADETIRAIWGYFVFAIGFIILGSFGLALGPFGFEAAFKASTSLFVSAGPLYGALTPATGGIEAGWPAFAELNAPILLWSSAIMLLGRLEILVVFAALNIRFWLGR